MIRPVAADGRIETGGAFTPIHRPRVVERIQSAATQRIVLIVAPAGYGKSVALRQYLETVTEPVVTFAVHEEHSTLLGFARGLSEALDEIAPNARKTLSGAFEKSRSSSRPGIDLAMWLHAHIKTFSGVVAIDDLHLTENEPEICKLVVSLIERTKGRIKWIIASRSTLDLPVGSWLAYGETDLTVDEQDLRFTVEEARLTARASRVGVRDEELQQILEMTEGWPTALSFAVRSSTRSVDLRNIAASTREMVYRYLAEQVYEALDSQERDLLHFVGYLQEVDLAVLRCAGYDKAKALIERLRDRVAFIYPERPNVYRCHDLFRDFLQHQLEIQGDAAVEEMRLRVASALENVGNFSQAIEAYAAAGSETDTIRLLEIHGMALIGQAHGDVVAAAIDALSDETRAVNSLILALRGLREAEAGRFDRAESLLLRAIQKTHDHTIAADLKARLAVILFSQGRDVVNLLEPALQDELPNDIRASVLSLLTPAYARAGRTQDSEKALVESEASLSSVESEEVRARLLHRMGLTSFTLAHAPEKTASLFSRAHVLANEHALFVTSSAALTGLASLAQFYDDDITKYVWYSQQALNAASKAGDRFSMQSAILQLINAEGRRGNGDRVALLEQQLAAVSTSDVGRLSLIMSTKALMAAWNGDWKEAYRLLATHAGRSYYNFDRAFNGAMQSLYALMAELREEALTLAEQTMSETERDADSYAHFYAQTTADMSRSVCAIVQALAGRLTASSRILQRPPMVNGSSADATREVAWGFYRSVRSPALSLETRQAITVLNSVGHGGIARVFEAALNIQEANAEPSNHALTKAEMHILQSLANGLSPKQIAEESGRSVHTIRAHIQNVIQKLGCSGRNEAITAARKRGILG